MSESKDFSGETGRPAMGAPVSSPRAYFGRASRATSGPLRPAAGGPAAEHAAAEAAWGAEAPAAAAAPPLAYRAGDPALRLFQRLRLPGSSIAPLTGAIVTLSGVRDGEHERLLVDLGTTLVRATTRRDPAAGTLALVLSRTQSAETYRGLLASLRYANDAEAPSDGVRHVAVQGIDAAGTAQAMASVAVRVGEIPAADAAQGEGIVHGETVRFNVEGDYTLFWWPRLLPGAADRLRRARATLDAAEAEAPEAAGSYFSGGGRLYRLFGRQAPAAAAPPPPRHANDDPAAGGDAEAVWTPDRGGPPPGFARARMLRFEDVFGSDTQDALARRLIEQRLAAGA